MSEYTTYKNTSTDTQYKRRGNASRFSDNPGQPVVKTINNTPQGITYKNVLQYTKKAELDAGPEAAKIQTTSMTSKKFNNKDEFRNWLRMRPEFGINWGGNYSIEGQNFDTPESAINALVNNAADQPVYSYEDTPTKTASYRDALNYMKANGYV